MNRTRVVLLIVAAFIGVAPGAEAQLGGLKKKLKEAVGGEKKPEPQQAAAITFSGNLVELTEPVLDGLVRGLQTEIALRKEFNALLATYPTDAQFRMCVAQVPVSEEGMKVVTANAPPDNATTAQMQEAMQKMTPLLEALKKKLCPRDPGDWGGGKKEQRLKEIVAKAAEAVGPGPTPGGEGQDGDEAASPVVALISVDAYSMIKERVIPFCTSPLGTQPVDPNARVATVPGTGQGINFVYTAAEARALPGRCKGIMALLAQLP